MKKSLIAGAVAAMVMSAPAIAQQPARLDQVLEELRALGQRVDKLEQDNQRLEAQNAELKASNDRLDATTAYLRSNASATRKEMAEEAPRIARITDLEKGAKSAEWASKISWRGDARYRHEVVDPEEAANDQTRQRIRARFGLTARVTDTVSGTVQLATNGGNNDPRSTNQTLGQGFDRKGVAIDLAYVDWKAAEGLNVQLGKMPLPFTRVASYFWDADITPEGGAFKFAKGAFFANAYGFWLSESSTGADSNVWGAQLGVKQKFSDAFTLTGAVHYYDTGALQDEITTTAGACTANPAFFGGPQGNTTFVQAGCARLLNDYEIIEVLAQADMKLGSLPLTVFANASQNEGAVNDLDQAWAAGITIGRASDPMTWDFGLAYQKTEKDALLGQFVDSDFGGGITDVEGAVFKIGFAPTKNWVLNGTYFSNDRFVDVGTERGYDRWQLDTNYRF